ncbi:MAG: acetamidase [Armatimonadetes bacterium]|jgi:amidase|nr:acetamidase [Armatimonadota bacterium]
MSEPTTHRLQPEIYYYTFGPNPPALRVRSGDRVVARTRDARGYDETMAPLPEERKQRHPDCEYCSSNPLVGPIYVEDANPGDVLAVQIEAIQLTRPSAWSRHNQHFGCFTGEGPGRRLLFNAPVPEQQYDWQLDLARGVGRLALPNSRIGAVEIPLHPFIGSIGVAPRFGRVETALTPGEYGGNMDCIETRAGTTLYLPVWVRGAYLAFGDVHAAQGDGEICGVALETTAEVTLRLWVLPGRALEWPRLEDDTHLMAVGNARPLWEAIQIAHLQLVEWLVADYGYDRWEALQVLSQVGTMRIPNVVDPAYTAIAKFPKRFLP